MSVTGSRRQFTAAHQRGGRSVVMTYRDPNESGVALDPSLVAVAPEAESADDARSDELHCQDGVHLADERIPDFGSTIRYGSAVLWRGG